MNGAAFGTGLRERHCLENKNSSSTYSGINAIKTISDYICLFCSLKNVKRNLWYTEMAWEKKWKYLYILSLPRRLALVKVYDWGIVKIWSFIISTTIWKLRRRTHAMSLVFSWRLSFTLSTPTLTEALHCGSVSLRVGSHWSHVRERRRTKRPGGK